MTQKNVCKHERIVTASSGSRWFGNGDVHDDYEEKLYCWDCGAPMDSQPNCPEPLNLAEWEIIFASEEME